MNFLLHTRLQAERPSGLYPGVWRVFSTRCISSGMPVDAHDLNAGDGAISEALAQEGITPKYLAASLKRELEAEEVKSWLDRKTGRPVYTEPQVAWEVRQKARQDAHRLLGHYPGAKLNLDFSGILAAAWPKSNAVAPCGSEKRFIVSRAIRKANPHPRTCFRRDGHETG